jgi:hypothetical protein
MVKAIATPTYLIPHTSDQHKTRIRTRLRRPSHGSERRQPSKIMRRSLNHQENPPKTNISSQILPNRQALHQEIRRKRPSQEAKIENRAEPRILRPLQVQVFADAEDGGVRESGFVDVEEDVADGQVGQDHPVDFAFHPRVFFRGNGLVQFVGRVEEGHGDVAVAGAGDFPF